MAGLHIEHKGAECAVQARHRPFHHDKTCATEFDAHVKVQAQGCAYVHMVFEGKFHGLGAAPGAHHHVIGFALAHRHAGMRQVRHRLQQRQQLRLQRFQAGGRGFKFGFDVAGLCHHGVYFGLACSTLGLELADLFA